jgi:hypothetical protein
MRLLSARISDASAEPPDAYENERLIDQQTSCSPVNLMQAMYKFGNTQYNQQYYTDGQEFDNGTPEDKRRCNEGYASVPRTRRRVDVGDLSDAVLCR